jgi:electron transfer flavoprotein alpha/beta subunit
MHIVVCVKQTPAGTDIKVDEKTGCLIRDGVESEINPFDEYAVEEAVKIKEKFPGSTVSALTMGPPQADQVLREAIARGCDNGFHLCDKAFAGSDTWATSYSLSKGIEKISAEKGKVDIVICGKQTTDSDTGHIGPQIAQWLGWPNVAFVRKVEELTEKNIRVERMMEEGYDVLEMPLPCVISVLKEINTPRISSLKGRLASKKAKMTVWTHNDIGCDESKLGVNGSPTSVVRSFVPKRETKSVVIEGETAKDKAKKLVSLLKEQKLI